MRHQLLALVGSVTVVFAFSSHDAQVFAAKTSVNGDVVGKLNDRRFKPKRSPGDQDDEIRGRKSRRPSAGIGAKGPADLIPQDRNNGKKMGMRDENENRKRVVEMVLELMDLDRDDSISKKELESVVRRLKSFDKNRDGRISRDELQKAANAQGNSNSSRDSQSDFQQDSDFQSNSSRSGRRFGGRGGQGGQGGGFGGRGGQGGQGGGFGGRGGQGGQGGGFGGRGGQGGQGGGFGGRGGQGGQGGGFGGRGGQGGQGGGSFGSSGS